MSKTPKTGFTARRAQEQADYQRRRHELLEAAKHSPSAPLVGRDYDLAEELGGARQLLLFREIARAHGLDLEKPRDFEEAKRIFDDPDAEIHRRVVEVAREQNLKEDDPHVFSELNRRWPDVMDLLCDMSRRKAGLQPLGPRVTFSGNEPPAPADPTAQSPWAEDEFGRLLKRVAHEEGYDLKDRTQRLAAIAVLIRQFPHLAPSYGWALQRPTPRNPSLGYRPQPPDQGGRSRADDRNFGRFRT